MVEGLPSYALIFILLSDGDFGLDCTHADLMDTIGCGMCFHIVPSLQSASHEVIAFCMGFGETDDGDVGFPLRIATTIEFPTVLFGLDVWALPDGVLHGARGEGCGDHIFEFYLIWF